MPADATASFAGKDALGMKLARADANGTLTVTSARAYKPWFFRLEDLAEMIRAAMRVEAANAAARNARRREQAKRTLAALTVAVTNTRPNPKLTGWQIPGLRKRGPGSGAGSGGARGESLFGGGDGDGDDDDDHGEDDDTPEGIEDESSPADDELMQEYMREMLSDGTAEDALRSWARAASARASGKSDGGGDGDAHQLNVSPAARRARESRDGVLRLVVRVRGDRERVGPGVVRDGNRAMGAHDGHAAERRDGRHGRRFVRGTRRDVGGARGDGKPREAVHSGDAREGGETRGVPRRGGDGRGETRGARRAARRNRSRRRDSSRRRRRAPRAKARRDKRSTETRSTETRSNQSENRTRESNQSENHSEDGETSRKRPPRRRRGLFARRSPSNGDDFRTRESDAGIGRRTRESVVRLSERVLPRRFLRRRRPGRGDGGGGVASSRGVRRRVTPSGRRFAMSWRRSTRVDARRETSVRRPSWTRKPRTATKCVDSPTPSSTRSAKRSARNATERFARTTRAIRSDDGAIRSDDGASRSTKGISREGTKTPSPPTWNRTRRCSPRCARARRRCSWAICAGACARRRHAGRERTERGEDYWMVRERDGVVRRRRERRVGARRAPRVSEEARRERPTRTTRGDRSRSHERHSCRRL